MAVSAAVALGVRRLVAPSAGNAAGALAAYGAAAHVEVLVAMPDDTPRPFVEECRHYGAQVELVPGTISDSGRWLRRQSVARRLRPVDPEGALPGRGQEDHGLRAVGTVRWPLPRRDRLSDRRRDGSHRDVEGLRRDGDHGLDRPGRPRLVSVQSDGCAPVVEGFRNDRQSDPALARPHNHRIRASSAQPHRRFPCLRAIRETEGHRRRRP